MMNEFSVCQFFDDDSYEYVVRFVSAENAVRTALKLKLGACAKFGLVKRIIITDGGDSINWEWEYGKGIIFPK